MSDEKNRRWAYDEPNTDQKRQTWADERGWTQDWANDPMQTRAGAAQEMYAARAEEARAAKAAFQNALNAITAFLAKSKTPSRASPRLRGLLNAFPQKDDTLLLPPVKWGADYFPGVKNDTQDILPPVKWGSDEVKYGHDPLGAKGSLSYYNPYSLPPLPLTNYGGGGGGGGNYGYGSDYNGIDYSKTPYAWMSKLMNWNVNR